MQLASLDAATPVAAVADRFGCSGYVVDSVPLALWSTQLLQHVSFREMSRQIIAVGGDTDTIESIAGQVGGAWLGYQRLPRDLIDRLPERDALLTTTRVLVASATAGRWRGHRRRE
jgi:ADP-ribosylglycohydrolase